MTRAPDLGVVACTTCELVMSAKPPAIGICPRCSEPLRPRKRNANTRAWAFMIAAAALYVPANTLPIMVTQQFPVYRTDTIMSGVKYLWVDGSVSLAAIVFAASILVPMLKLCALAVLLVSSRRPSTWRQQGRTRLYHLLEIVGHWSMLDVFVVALLSAVVQLGRFASVEPGLAIIPFAGVVVLTMLASASFDPRTIWDRA